MILNMTKMQTFEFVAEQFNAIVPVPVAVLQRNKALNCMLTVLLFSEIL
jgi:hypothetical protein